jgi:hypothetical protein
LILCATYAAASLPSIVTFALGMMLTSVLYKGVGDIIRRDDPSRCDV